MITRTRIVYTYHYQNRHSCDFSFFSYCVLRYPYVTLVAYRRGAIELCDQLGNISRGNQHCVTLLNVKTKPLTDAFKETFVIAATPFNSLVLQ